MRGVEIKNLRWENIDLGKRVLHLRRSKTKKGKRVIPLNGPAWFAIEKLLERSKELGPVLPSDCVFFACENGKIDVAKPQKSWRTAWRSVTRSIECPGCGEVQPPGIRCVNETCGGDIKGVRSPRVGRRFHDLRHHAITELAESQASDSTILDLAGHVSRQMLEHYSHIRLKTKREAVEMLGRNSPALEGYVTNHVTNEFDGNDEKLASPLQLPELSEDILVELVGIEPTTSSLRTMRSPS
jgi:integrase